MKLHLKLFLSTLVATSAANSLDPNHYSCKFARNAIIYSTDNELRVPRLSFINKKGRRDFLGEEIRHQSTPMGRLLSVHLSEDNQVKKLSIVIPKVELEDSTSIHHFESIFVETRSSRGSLYTPISCSAAIQSVDRAQQGFPHVRR